MAVKITDIIVSYKNYSMNGKNAFFALFIFLNYLSESFFYLTRLFTDAKPGLVNSEWGLNDNAVDDFSETYKNMAI